MSASTVLNLKGTLSFNRYKNGAFQGRKELRGLVKIELKQNVDIEKYPSKDKDAFGATVATVPKRKPTDLTFSMQEFSKEQAQLVFMGEPETINTGAGTVTDEIVVAKTGISISLVHKNVTADSVVVTNSGATTTYVENTDYKINYAQGWITALDGGGIADSASLKVTYAYGARTGFKIDAEAIDLFRGELFLDGENLANGDQIEVLIPMAAFVSDTGLDFMSDKAPEFQFKGSCEKTDGYPTGYSVTAVTNS
jgi:hypothetical protein